MPVGEWSPSERRNNRRAADLANRDGWIAAVFVWLFAVAVTFPPF